MAKKISSSLISNPKRDFLLGWKTLIMTIMTKFKKKLQNLLKKCKNSWVSNPEKHSITFRNYTETYCQNREQVSWLLGPEKPKNRQKF